MEDSNVGKVELSEFQKRKNELCDEMRAIADSFRIGKGMFLKTGPEDFTADPLEGEWTLEQFERFPFPGFDPDAYRLLKEEERDPYFSSTPTDEIAAKCEAHGIRVVILTNSDIAVFPANSSSRDDQLWPRHLSIEGAKDERLKRLIAVCVEYKKMGR